MAQQKSRNLITMIWYRLRNKIFSQWTWPFSGISHLTDVSSVYFSREPKSGHLGKVSNHVQPVPRQNPRQFHFLLIKSFVWLAQSYSPLVLLVKSQFRCLHMPQFFVWSPGKQVFPRIFFRLFITPIAVDSLHQLSVDDIWIIHLNDPWIFHLLSLILH